MKSSILAIITILIICNPIQLPAANIGTIYSNLVQEKEYGTNDCGGYTARVIKNQAGQMEIYFTSHEGNCGIDGTKAEDVKYDMKKGTLSFNVPFEPSSGKAYYRFTGRITNSHLSGKLKLDYLSSPKYNRDETIKLKKTTKKKLFPRK